MATPNDKEKRAVVPEHVEPTLGDKIRHANTTYTPKRGEGALPTDVVVISDTNSMYNAAENSNIFDLYEVGSLKQEETSLPFVHGVELSGPKGEIVRFRSVFDDGALVNTIDETLYQMLKGRLAALTPSEKILRMADGRRVPSVGVWKGTVTVSGISREGTFEIFNSNNAWAMLFGKPLLKTFNAVHDYTNDTIRIPQKEGIQWTVLTNQYANTHGFAAKLLANLTVDIKQLIKVPHQSPRITKKARLVKAGDAKTQGDDPNAYKLRGGVTTPLEGSLTNQPLIDTEHYLNDTVISPENTNIEQCENTLSENWDSVWLLDKAAGENPAPPGIEQPDVTKTFEPTLLTRKTDPHNPACIKAILDEITIGQDLTPEQREQVRELIAEFAECFALSMSEVTPVEGAAHRLDIPRDKQFRTKINQRPQSPPQREYFNGVIDKMLEAGIIRPIDHQDVKCCGATTLAKKAHEGDGLTLSTLQHRVNDQCIAAGFPTPFQDLPPIEEPEQNANPLPTQTKWR